MDTPYVKLTYSNKHSLKNLAVYQNIEGKSNILLKVGGKVDIKNFWKTVVKLYLYSSWQ